MTAIRPLSPGQPIYIGAMNSLGTVIGTMQLSTGKQVPFLFKSGKITLLATPPPTSFGPVEGFALNDNGVGAGDDTSLRPPRAMEYINGTTINLGADPSSTDPNGHGSTALGINNALQAVGLSDDSQPFNTLVRAVLFSNGKVTDLAEPAGVTFAEALAINNHGVIVGWSNVGHGHAMMWTGTYVDPSSVTDLSGSATASASHANALNNLVPPTIVGEASPATNGFAAIFRADGQGYTTLGTLPGDTSSTAKGVNDAGEIVGVSYDASSNGRAFLYTSQKGMIDLNSFLPPGTGWSFDYAASINNAHQIAGSALLNGLRTGFILTP